MLLQKELIIKNKKIPVISYHVQKPPTIKLAIKMFHHHLAIHEWRRMPENIEAGEIQENVFAVKINVSYPEERAIGRGTGV